jgi:hypothetical protein
MPLSVFSSFRGQKQDKGHISYPMTRSMVLTLRNLRATNLLEQAGHGKSPAEISLGVSDATSR